MSDREIVVANMIEGDATFPKGRLVYLIYIPGDPTNAQVRAHSRSGRWVTVWRAMKKLECFRIKRLPCEGSVAQHWMGYSKHDPTVVVEKMNDGGY